MPVRLTLTTSWTRPQRVIIGKAQVEHTTSAYPLKADVAAAPSNSPFSAITGLMHRSKKHRYSITWSALARSVGGTVRPSALAVLRLITNSNLVGCRTGRSAGFAPL